MLRINVKDEVIVRINIVPATNYSVDRVLLILKMVKIVPCH